MQHPFDINGLVAKARHLPYIDITRLKPGDKVAAWTLNNLYEMTIVDPQQKVVRVLLPKYGSEPLDVWLNGSTFGGSMLWCGRIGHQMNLEIIIPGHGAIVTTPIQNARIEGNGWQYEMEWTIQEPSDS
jgi:hypothetical protein